MSSHTARDFDADKRSVSAEFDQKLEIYRVVNDLQQYEGAGIWSRFNIIASLNAVLFGAVAFMFSSRPPGAHTLILILSLGGALLSLWALYVLRRLWLWHTHWKETLQQIEQAFPVGLPRPFLSRPARLAHRPSWYQSWLLAYTQPFLLILVVIWLSIAVVTSVGVGFENAPPENSVPSAHQELEGRP